MWPADHAEGLRAPQVLALGGRGAQRAGTWRPVDAAAPPGGHTHKPSATGAGGHLAEAPRGGQASACPFPFACHAPLSVSLYTGAWPERGAQGSSPGAVTGFRPILMAPPAWPSCLRPTIVQVPLIGMFILGFPCLVALGQTLLSPSIWVLGTEADDLLRKPITLPYRWPYRVA